MHRLIILALKPIISHQKIVLCLFLNPVCQNDLDQKKQLTWNSLLIPPPSQTRHVSSCSYRDLVCFPKQAKELLYLYVMTIKYVTPRLLKLLLSYPRYFVSSQFSQEREREWEGAAVLFGYFVLRYVRYLGKMQATTQHFHLLQFQIKKLDLCNIAK